MKPTPSNPTKRPRVPKGKIMYSYATDLPRGPALYRKRLPGCVPVAIVPCRTAKEARAVVKLHGSGLRLPEHRIAGLATQISCVAHPKSFRKDEWDDYRDRLKEIIRDYIAAAP